MTKRRFSFSVMLAVLFAATVGLAGCGGEGDSSTTEAAGDDSSIAIKVGNESMTMGEFNQQLDQRLQRIKQRLKQLPKSQREKQLQRYRQRFKQRMAQQIETQLTLQHFVNQSDITVSDSEVEQQMSQITEQFPDEKTMKQALKKQGQSLDSLRERIRERIKMQKFIEQETGDIEVSPEEAKQYFEQNRQEFDQPEQVKARHILIKDDTGAEEKINELKGRLDQGTDFSELARQESEGPSAKKGGSLGFITRDRMVKPFSDAAFQLDPGEVSDPVKTQYGWHLIKVDERKDAQSAQYEDVSDTIVQQVRSRKRRQQSQQLIQDLKSRVEIVNNVTTSGATKKSGPMQGSGAKPQGQ